MASSHYSLGQLLRKLNRLKDAEQSYRTAQSILTELTQQFPAVKDYFDSLASSHNGLGNLLADGEQLEQALEQYRLAASLRERLVREHPQIPEYSIDLAGVYCNTASKLFDANKQPIAWYGLEKPLNCSSPFTNRQPNRESARATSKIVTKGGH